MAQLSGPDPHVAASAGWDDAPARKGFFTDTSICIGCKACEVACKEWNGVPAGDTTGFSLLGSSYDNTGALGASTWRHVAFIEQSTPHGNQDAGVAGQPVGPAVSEAVSAGVDAATTGDRNALGTNLDDVSVGAVPVGPVSLGMPGTRLPGALDPDGRRTDFRWLMSSDVCKHCTNAACLDVCPTGSLFRTEFGTVVVQDEICNGCGYCIPACPFGVIDRRTGDDTVKNVGIAQKCTLCYDRLGAGMEPACAKSCPTQSIQFGDLDELRERAARRVAALHEAGVPDARLYGEDPDDGIGGAGAIFLLLDEPEVYGLPPDPIVTTRDLPAMWRTAGFAALGLLAAAATSFLGRRP